MSNIPLVLRRHVSRFLLATLVACAASGSHAASTASARAAQQREPLDAREAMRLRAGILRAEDQRDPQESALRTALACRSAELRARAVRALGRIGDEATLPLVRLALADASADVQREAIFALGEMESPDAIVSLDKVLTSKDREQRALGAEALSKIAAVNESARATAGGAVVRRLLVGGGEADPSVVQRALLRCWRFGPKTPGLVGAVGAQYLRPEPEVSAAAVYAAMRLGDRRFGPMLELAARDPRADVRADAARGLGRLARLPGDEADKSPEHRAILVRRGLDLEPSVRVAAFGALAPFAPDAKMAAEMLQPSLESDDSGVQRAALGLVRDWAIGCDPAQLRAMATGARRDLVPEAAAALAAVAGADAVGTLESLAKSGDWVRRSAAATAVGRKGFPLEAATPLLDGLLEDPDPRVVAAALEASVECGRPDASVLALAHLGAKDPVVRAVAAGALPGLIGKGAERAEVLAALRRTGVEAMRDAAPDARIAALDALAEIGGPDVREDLAGGMDDPDFTVRLHARGLLRAAGVSPLPPAGIVTGTRTTAFYADAAKAEVDPARQRLRLVTERGIVDVDLLPAEAVLTVRNVAALARAGFFDGVTFHRVVPDFVAQGGDPRGDGWGGPAGAVRCEINPVRFRAGAVGMALSGKDTGGSQFFVTLADQPHLDGGYTVFGQLAPGSLPVARALRRFDVIEKASIVDVPTAWPDRLAYVSPAPPRSARAEPRASVEVEALHATP